MARMRPIDSSEIAVATEHGGMRVDAFAEAVAACIRAKNIVGLTVKVTVAKLVVEHREARCESCGVHSMTYPTAPPIIEATVTLVLFTGMDMTALTLLRGKQARLGQVYADGLIERDKYLARKALLSDEYDVLRKGTRRLEAGCVFDRVPVEAHNNVEFLVRGAAVSMLRTMGYVDEANSVERGKDPVAI